MYVEHTATGVVFKFRPQPLYTEKMRIQTPAAYFVSPRLSYHRMPEACQHRADKHYASAQFRTALQKLITADIVHVHLIGLKSAVARCITRHFYPDILQQADLIVHIRNIGYILDAYGFRSQQRGANHL